MRFVLGLDIGVSSLGWAVLAIDANDRPTGILRSGVRLFQAGVDGGKSSPEVAMMRGNEQSRAKPRRDARAMRRQTWRRARRKKKLLGQLIRADLLPQGDVRTPEQIDAYVKSLDEVLRDRWEKTGASHVARQRLPYILRRDAATRPIERDELGRALYHLAQRRGFLSNKKAPKQDEESRSEVKKAIGELAEKIASHDTPTLGAYLASVDPDEERLRGRWTSRQMYLDEFNRIWSVQAKPHSLSDECRDAIHDAIFHQRPLKDQRHLIGECSLVRGEKRCPLADRIAQRFRVLQQVNHLKLTFDDLSERPPTTDERRALIDALLREGDLTMARARRTMGLPPSVAINLERGGEKRLVGHRTDAKLGDVFGAERWDNMSEAEKERAAHDVKSVRKPEVLRSIGRNRWGLDRDAAEKLSTLTFEEGYASHSRTAMRRLIPRMEQDGLSYSEARKDEFPDSFRSEEALDALLPLDKCALTKDVRSPSVMRALTEVRKLVNAVVKRYGKPERIHVELARDMKAGRGKREKIAKNMRSRQKERETAAAAITRELGVAHPKPWMTEKWLLAEECGWVCPYTGRGFGVADLLGKHSQFDVEHIWPFSRSLDNSFVNKTICYHEENRNRKGGRTPAEAYAADKLEEMLRRVRSFRSDPFTRGEKLRRFTEPIEEGFTQRHLQETRYINRLACDYLGLLYGGRVEATGTDAATRRIVTPSGGLTAWLRRGWRLDGVLSNRDEKERGDHRHHAIDAIVVACADQKAIQKLANAAERMEREGRERAFDRIDEPWDDFARDVRSSIEQIVVSHRQSRRVRGALHKETIYSKPHNDKHRVRKELVHLTTKEIERGKIVDKRALAAIWDKLKELDEAKPARAFKDPSNLPLVRGRDGGMVRLRRVRVEVGDKPVAFGRDERRRFMNPSANHHTRIVVKRNKKGDIVGWEDWPITLAEVSRHAAKGLRPEPSNDLVFTLAADEYIELDDEDGEGRTLYRVMRISKGDIEVCEHWDGRTSAERQAARERTRLRGASMKQRNARKVFVSCLGEVFDAGG